MLNHFMEHTALQLQNGNRIAIYPPVVMTGSDRSQSYFSRVRELDGKKSKETDSNH